MADTLVEKQVISPWWSKISSNEGLLQGDLIFQCPHFVPKWEGVNLKELRENDLPDFKLVKYNVIVLSQSCDIENKKIRLIQVCGWYTLEHMKGRHQAFQGETAFESLRQGMMPAYHLMYAPDETAFEDSFLVVDFKSLFGIDPDVLSSLAKLQEPRYRLQSPYLEHLSQAFARFFMRVGLPSSIPSFKELTRRNNT